MHHGISCFDWFQILLSFLKSPQFKKYYKAWCDLLIHWPPELISSYLSKIMAPTVRFCSRFQSLLNLKSITRPDAILLFIGQLVRSNLESVLQCFSLLVAFTFIRKTVIFLVQCWYCQLFCSKVKFGILMQTFSFRAFHCHWNLILLSLKVSVIKFLFLLFSSQLFSPSVCPCRYLHVIVMIYMLVELLYI